jgi:S-adenosylmethionine hydrolase
MTRPFISLLSDFGARDPSAAIMHGVILGIAPAARIVDISHEVHKFAIRDGALLLWCALPYLPVGFHVAVVDPGVGTSRRPVAINSRRGDVLIGPDNGLLVAAAERVGGIESVRVLEAPEYRLPVVSTSFHGRDIFAPAAAHLAAGVPFDALGPQVEAASLVASPIPEPQMEPGTLRTSVVYVDTFGNVKLAGLRSDLERAIGAVSSGQVLSLEIRAPSSRMTAPWVATFGEVPAGSALVYEDSYGRLCVAATEANAAKLLGLVEDTPIVVRRP